MITDLDPWPEPEHRWCARERWTGRWLVQRSSAHGPGCHTFTTWEAAYAFARQEAADARLARVCGVRLGWHRDLRCERPRGHYGDCAPADGPARSASAPHAGGAR